MDDDSGETRGVDEVAGVGRDESELEWLVRGCLRVGTVGNVVFSCQLFCEIPMGSNLAVPLNILAGSNGMHRQNSMTLALLNYIKQQAV